MANRLSKSSSAYLRQHADNPVDWFEWGDEATRRATELDRPIFLSIGYAACHWCHVMAHESFEDESIAEILNRDFVAIKVDREERPDVDALYMAATIAVSGHGGWPMSVFLTPDGRAFMAGTYYPPSDRHGQPGFPRLLTAMTDAWSTQREAVYEQAESITSAVERELRIIDRLKPRAPARSSQQVIDELVNDLSARCDNEGGFGSAPKFPHSSYVEMLLRRLDDATNASAVQRTLDAMSRQGLYDHLAGGFARYSVDDHWIVPHFEKMLYDQAQLVATYLRADRAYGGNTPWFDVALDTIDFVLRDLAVADGLASSLDADSSGHEGAHVTWTPSEVAAALDDSGHSDDVDRVLARWNISAPGNFEGRSIPVLSSDAAFVIPPELVPARDSLRRARALRPQPGRDDKVVLEWNAMMIVAMLETRVDDIAGDACRRLRQLHHTHFDGTTWWRTNSRRAHATATDLAWLIDAHVKAFEETGDRSWLSDVPSLIGYLLVHHWDGEVPTSRDPHVGRGLFTTSNEADALVLRPKDLFDDATPSSHGVSARALARYAMVSGDLDARAVADRLVELAGEILSEHPSAMPELLGAFSLLDDGREIVIPGGPSELSATARARFDPSSVLVTGSSDLELLHGRLVGSAYVCSAGVCQMPVTTPEELARSLERSPR